MQRELKLYLWDMLAAGEDILRFLDHVSLSKYRESQLLRPAVERIFEIIGEALTQARHLYPQLRDQIGKHREIIASRNRVIHGYFAVNDEILYSTARDFLPTFLDQVREILATLST